MGEDFENISPNYGLKLPLTCDCQLIVTLRALTESLDKCRRRYQVRIRRLEQQCAGQGRQVVQGALLANNNTDTAESRSTRASSRTEEAL